ncbi:hypothetical protein LSG31_07330 [Fodinisporobacter ferrooxydans]|uniref:Uncharacterized protein n=1 Tax=Fodinisporobacter ferrooxydans TaxID=2901836 RepID=A0ABY4CNG3_9BACL|nr:hypothetical protein LSG31_07330 [Alicyclobacillaceae bacterium MYW30-H2]
MPEVLEQSGISGVCAKEDKKLETVDQHLKQAFSHLREALDLSIQMVQNDTNAKGSVGRLWEGFLGEFFNMIRVKGKESRLNLLSFVKFPSLWK